MVKIRLMRIGTKGRPFYRVVAVDERKKRTGQYIEALGTYNPLTEPHEIILKQDRIDFWIKNGAVLSDGYLRITKQAPQKPPRKPKKEKKSKEPEVTKESKESEPEAKEAPANTSDVSQDSKDQTSEVSETEEATAPEKPDNEPQTTN